MATAKLVKEAAKVLGKKVVKKATKKAVKKTATKKVAKKVPTKTATKNVRKTTGAKKYDAKAEKEAKKAATKAKMDKIAASKKDRPFKEVSTRETPKKATKKTATKKTAVKKTATKKTATKKTAVKKTARKTPAKKTPVKPKKTYKKPIGPQTAQESVAGRPMEGPSNYKGNYFKNKTAREADVSGRPVQGPSGIEAFKAGKKVGASKARSTAKKRLGKVVKGKGAISKTARKIGKKTKKIAGGKTGTAAIAGGAGYMGAKMGSGNKAVTPSPATAKPSKYFSREEIEAARFRLYGKKNK